jgi:lisH domain-containing protein FOPNL
MSFLIVLREALENKGIANEIKAKLRSEIFTILDDNTFEKPRISQENLLINELIREYMEFNNYNFSKSVFLKGKYLFNQF